VSPELSERETEQLALQIVAEKCCLASFSEWMELSIDSSQENRYFETNALRAQQSG